MDLHESEQYIGVYNIKTLRNIAEIRQVHVYARC